MTSPTQANPNARLGRIALGVNACRAIVAALIWVAFSHAKEYGFVNWDDPAYILENPGFRLPFWQAMKWEFTHYHLGHYQPLNWVGFTINYALVGLDPQRLHVSQIVLHIIATLCVHQLARKLLPLFRLPRTVAANEFAAAMSAIVFAIHPLRVESVAWLSARADLLAMIFICLSTLAYLRHARGGNAKTPWPAFVLFVLAVLTKVHSVVLPAIFILLDWYPLNRLPRDRSCTNVEFRPIWREKFAFLIVSAVASINAFIAADTSAASLEKSPLAFRLIQIPFSIAFYLGKSIYPGHLSTLYEFPGEFGLTHPWVIQSIVACVALIILLLVLRRRAPGLLVAAIAYVVTLLPISGIGQRGPQLAADRYSYLPTLPIAILIGAGFQHLFMRSKLAAYTAAGILIVIWLPQTMLQVTTWRDSETLWRNAISADNHNATAHAMLAHVHMDEGRIDDAIHEFDIALRIRPTQPLVHRNLAALYSRQGRLDDAILHYEADLVENPADAASRYFLGACYERRGDPDRASRHFRAALDINPDFAPAHLGLARLFLSAGYVMEAEPRLRRVIELDPENATALELLAQLCANTGRTSDAATFYDRAIAQAERRQQFEAIGKLRATRAALATSAPSR